MDNGLYDALALIDDAVLVDPFSLTFVWLDPTSVPGMKPYTIYDSVFLPRETGNAVPFLPGVAVPVPLPIGLLGVGLLAFCGVRRRYRSS